MLKKNIRKWMVFSLIFLILLSFFFTVSSGQSLVQKRILIEANVKAKVYISNIFRGYTPLSIKLKIGRYPIRLEAPGYQTYRGTITVSSTGKTRFTFYLKKLTSSTASGWGYLKIDSDIPVWVYLDNIKMGKAPFSPDRRKVKAGFHTVKLIPLDKNYAPKTFRIKIIKGKTYVLKVRFRQQVYYYWLNITTNVKAKVYINNKYYGTTPFKRKLSKGTYSIKLVPYNSNQYETLFTSIDLNSNKNLHFNLNSKRGSVYFNIPYGARVYINGKLYNLNNSRTIYLKPGRYTIKIVYHELQVTKVIYIQAGQNIRITLGLTMEISG